MRRFRSGATVVRGIIARHVVLKWRANPQRRPEDFTEEGEGRFVMGADPEHGVEWHEPCLAQ